MDGQPAAGPVSAGDGTGAGGLVRRRGAAPLPPGGAGGAPPVPHSSNSPYNISTSKNYYKKRPIVSEAPVSKRSALFGRSDRSRKRNIALCILFEPCKTLGFMRFLLLFRKHQSIFLVFIRRDKHQIHAFFLPGNKRLVVLDTLLSYLAEAPAPEPAPSLYGQIRPISEKGA